MKYDELQIDQWYNSNIDIQTRTIYFGPGNMQADLCTERAPWEVDDWSVQNLIKGLHVLENLVQAEIKIVWLSFGGDWDAGMAAYDYIKNMKSFVTMECYGRVRSMGTIILQACDLRVLSPNCCFMIHYGSLGIDVTHSKDAQALAREDEKCNTLMEDIYLEKIKKVHSRYSRAKLHELMKYDNYMSPRDAIELGLADKEVGV